MIMTMARRRPVRLSRFVPVPYDDVVAVLRHDVIDILSDTPTADGPVTVTLRPGPAAIVSCPVAVHVGPLIDDDDETIGRPLWWEASRLAAWFPTLDAGLEAVPGATGTELRLTGGYQSPFGSLGAYADSFIGHRFATACLEHFLTDLSQRLTARIASRNSRAVRSPDGPVCSLKPLS
jgi:hypothetical protein